MKRLPQSLLKRRYLIPAALLLVIAGLALVGALSQRHSDAHRSSSVRAAHSTPNSSSATADSPLYGQYEAAAGSSTAAGYGADYSAVTSSANKSPAGTASAKTGGYVVDILPTSHGRYLVRDGFITMVVKRGQLNATVLRMTQFAKSMGGYVVASSVGTAGTGGVTPMSSSDATTSSGAGGDTLMIKAGDPYATLTVRVPAQKYDRAVARFSAMGEVKQLSTSSSDVTGDYVDLQARLRHYQAVERRLLSFLSQARTIHETLTVQDRIDKTQLTVEPLSAKLKAMSETIAYSTMSVTLTEKQPVAVAISSTGTFGGALGHSLHLIADGALVTFVAIGAAVPFLVLIGVVIAIAWLLRRAFGRTVPKHANDRSGL